MEAEENITLSTDFLCKKMFTFWQFTYKQKCVVIDINNEYVVNLYVVKPREGLENGTSKVPKHNFIIRWVLLLLLV